jgi:hypothetical protein
MSIVRISVSFVVLGVLVVVGGVLTVINVIRGQGICSLILLVLPTDLLGLWLILMMIQDVFWLGCSVRLGIRLISQELNASLVMLFVDQDIL